MVRQKVKLKQEYKKLVRAGKIKDADSKLREYWKLCGIVKSGSVSKPKAVKSDKYTKEYLESLSFKKLKEIGLEFGTTDRSKSKLIQVFRRIRQH